MFDGMALYTLGFSGHKAPCCIITLIDPFQNPVKRKPVCPEPGETGGHGTDRGCLVTIRGCRLQAWALDHNLVGLGFMGLGLMGSGFRVQGLGFLG